MRGQLRAIPSRTGEIVAYLAAAALAMFEGTANPIPTDPAECEYIAVLMPITWPRRLNVGPPELPRFRPEPRLPPRGRDVINSCGDASTASPAHTAAPLFARN